MTLAEVHSLILTGTQEGMHLEYKAAEALNDRDEISKDVSAMANASGGTIIYGVKEFQDKGKKHLPEKIDPCRDHNREYLDQVINSNIFPPIVGVAITAVDLPEGGFVFVVQVPPSDTVHQAATFRYHQRYNFECKPMYDHQIRDVMNRSKHPKVSLRFSLDSAGTKMFPIFLNDGPVYAKYIRCSFDVPNHFLDLKTRISGTPVLENIRFEITNVSVVHPKSSLITQYPLTIAEGLAGNLNQRRIFSLGQKSETNTPKIKWLVYADNAPMAEGSIDLWEDVWRKSTIR